MHARRLPPRPAEPDFLFASLLTIHKSWAWVVVVGNGVAGVWALAAQGYEPLRARALWWFTIFVEVAIFVQAVLGVAMVAGQDIEAPQFHMFYGFVAIISVGIAYSYRQSDWVRQHLYGFYGGVGLFLMGLGIRAMLIR